MIARVKRAELGETERTRKQRGERERGDFFHSLHRRVIRRGELALADRYVRPIKARRFAKSVGPTDCETCATQV